MSKEAPLVNRVVQSGLITLNMENWFPEAVPVHFDLKNYLFKELILKEKEFRAALKAHDWSSYEGQALLVYCSTDAIIPVWAYMLVATYAEPHASVIFQGDEQAYYAWFLDQKIQSLDVEPYRDQRVVIKGCSDRPVPPAAYLKLTAKLRPVSRSIMYGEPCSTVPIYKRPKVE